MRILANTLYVTQPNSYLSLDGENVVILVADTESKRVPLHNLQSIVSFNYTGASPALMGECAKRDIALTFLTENGRFLARVIGKTHGNVLLRKNQYIASDNEAICIEISKNIISAKLFNSRLVIERAIRDYGLRLDAIKLKEVSNSLSSSIKQLQSCENLDEIRGIEGEGANRYFSVFDDLILQQKEDFHFITRNRRPPTDNINALLSFVYTLLANDIASALETVGLDPYVGFLHTDRPGRVSLALDLIEELRSILADRFVLNLVNTRQISGTGFNKKEDGAVIMDDDTRKIVLVAWQKKKQELTMHSMLKENIKWGLIPYYQSLLMSRYLRGDIDSYPPFFW
ncbi:MAG: CRISPR-associated endonuclease Cas1 [Firmicutes bacterium ADurb.Bin146]|nr:MAG: CRISPR-associated endonuclease Cas1 [Firmicutes bacterium ADurb.Bin146]